MPIFREAVEQLAKNFTCAALKIEAPATEWLSNAISSIPGSRSTPFSEQNREPYERARRAACGSGASGSGSPPVSFPPPPIPPGQCDAVLYRFSWEYTRTDGLVQAQTGFRYFGPLGEPFIVQSGGRDRVLIPTKGKFDSGPTPTVQDSQFLSAPLNTVASTRIFDIVRVDGQPDDCGIPDGGIRPEGSGDLDYEDEDGNPITEPYDIVGGPPVFGPGGATVLPFELCLAAVCLDITFNLSTGDVNFNFGGQPGSSPCCPPIETPPELPPEQGDPPPPSDDMRLWGIKVNCTVDDAVCPATQIGVGGPVLYVPSLGVVRFAIEVGGSRAWTVDQPIKTLSQFVPVNAPATAYAYDLLPQPGVSIQVQEVFVKPPESNV